KMAGSPALLLLLALELCCPGTHSQKDDMRVTFRDRRISHPKLGQRLELECQTTNAENGVFWVRQNKDGTLHFIAFISSLSRVTFKEKQPSTRFEARKDRNIYHLAVKSFTAADEGNYFCFMNANQELYFSRGQPAFFPVTTTAAPTALAPTTQSGITRKDPCLKTLDPGSSAAGRERGRAVLRSTDTEGDAAGITGLRGGKILRASSELDNWVCAAGRIKPQHFIPHRRG
uniref:Ig-like domain-containing protein n=1 Tax=Athene cunicularia TaxID=194338 RepID=A0A663ND13_ATHCN